MATAEMTGEEPQGRERWSSRPAFIIAAIGSAIGLGNIWRFPALAFQFGGGAFFIPYVMALLFVGIPVLLLELALGQTYQSGDAIVFGKMHPRLRGVGIASVYCGLMVVIYYCALLGWALRCFGYAFQDPLPWAAATSSPSGSWGWVVEHVVGMDAEYLAAPNNLEPTEVVGANFASLVLVWLTIFTCLAFGVKWTGRFAYVTMGLPVVVLLALLIKSGTLEGNKAGIDAYIGKWDLSTLSEQPQQWSMAVSQIFFSLSVTFGVMTAYGSYNKRDQNVVQDSVIIGVANSFFSFLCGFAAFGTLGHLAHVQGVSVSDLKFSGPGLMFGTYPVALNTGSGGEHWNRLLFLTIFLLGVDSAFSLVEAVVTVLKDTKGFAKVPRVAVVGVTCLMCLLLGLPYTTDAGLVLLDVVDYYINFVMLFVGFFECFSAGWLFQIREQVDRLGLRATVGFLLCYNLSVLAAAAVALSLGGKTGLTVGMLFGLGCAGMGTMLSLSMIRERHGKTEGELVWDLFFGNVEALRSEINSVVAAKGQWRVPLFWSFLIKFFIPPVLVLLIIGSLASETADGKSTFGHYEGYPAGYQVLGIVMALLALVIVAVGAIWPNAYAMLAPLETDTTAADEEPTEQPVEVAASAVAADFCFAPTTQIEL